MSTTLQSTALQSTTLQPTTLQPTTPTASDTTTTADPIGPSVLCLFSFLLVSSLPAILFSFYVVVCFYSN